MDLQSFIRETLVQIAQGIEEANSRLAEKGSLAKVNPPTIALYNDKEGYAYVVASGDFKSKNAIVPIVEFDVAVHGAESTKDGKGGALRVAVAELGGKRETERSTSSISHIHFRVPMLLPQSHPVHIAKDGSVVPD